MEEINANSSTPVVDAPAPPVTGAAVSRLEEVPTGLRNASADAARAARAGGRTDAVAPELTNRRTTSEGGPVTPVGIAEGNDGQRIVTDEDAFSVDTPGGGVLAKQREDQNYRPEPPTVLGGN
jgi:hypothetical protein